MEFQVVYPEVIDEAIENSHNLLKNLCERSKRYTIEGIRECVINGKMQFWVATENNAIIALCLTQINQYHQSKYLQIIAGTGTNRHKWQGYVKVLEQWAKDMNCNGVESVARKGWLKVFGDYKQTHINIEKDF